MRGSNHSDRLCFGLTVSGSVFNLRRQEGSTAEGGAVRAGVACRSDPGAGGSRRSIRSRNVRLIAHPEGFARHARPHSIRGCRSL